jgi:hypothetical protein
MKHKCEEKVDCELKCKATAAALNSISDDLLKEDRDLKGLLKDKENNELENKSKPVN